MMYGIRLLQIWICIIFPDLPPVLRIRDVYLGSRIPDPEFYPSRIPDPKTATKERGEKKPIFKEL
jgi:hypothetical protein